MENQKVSNFFLSLVPYLRAAEDKLGDKKGIASSSSDCSSAQRVRVCEIGMTHSLRFGLRVVKNSFVGTGCLSQLLVAIRLGAWCGVWSTDETGHIDIIAKKEQEPERVPSSQNQSEDGHSGPSI